MDIPLHRHGSRATVSRRMHTACWAMLSDSYLAHRTKTNTPLAMRSTRANRIRATVHTVHATDAYFPAVMIHCNCSRSTSIPNGDWRSPPTTSTIMYRPKRKIGIPRRKPRAAGSGENTVRR